MIVMMLLSTESRPRDGEARQVVISLGSINLLASIIPLPQSEVRDSIGDAWSYKKVFGMMNPDRREDAPIFPAWQPGAWTSVCVSASSLRSFVKININGEIVSDYKDGHIEGVDGNIFLMNSEDQSAPSHGAITDVNVWSRQRIIFLKRLNFFCSKYQSFFIR